ncbi:MAG: hypothetical protein KHX46_10925, partial [Clostridiales bacterium]|nr:hypothetical protein [Clostridiales bacterium]
MNKIYARKRPRDFILVTVFLSYVSPNSHKINTLSPSGTNKWEHSVFYLRNESHARLRRKYRTAASPKMSKTARELMVNGMVKV